MDDVGFGNDLADGEALVEGFRRILEDHLNVGTQGAHSALGDFRDILSSEVDVAGCRGKEANQAFTHGGFATAGFSDKSERFSLPDGQGNVVNCFDPPGAAHEDAFADGKVHFEVFGFQKWFRHG